MGDFLAELFERFDQEQQAKIRAAESTTEEIVERGTAAVKNRRLAAGSPDDSDWVLEPERDARADAAGVVFVAYANALWQETDAASEGCVRDFLAKVEKLIEPVLTRYEWEGEGLISALRRQCQMSAWFLYPRLSSSTASTTSSTADSVVGSERPETEAGASSGVGGPVVYFKPPEILEFSDSWRKRIRGDADSTARSARRNGRTFAEGGRQEELLKDAREWALAELEKMAPAVPDVFQLKRRVVQQTLDEFVRRHRNYSDFQLNYEEFSSALWEEGWPSLEECAIEAIVASLGGDARHAGASEGDGSVSDRFGMDFALAKECPAFLEPAKAVRLAAIAKLRKDAADVVLRARPQTRQELEQCLFRVLSEYAQHVFDKMAETQLHSASPGAGLKAYGDWLKFQCLAAVITDICQPIIGQFLISVRYVKRIVGDVPGPADLRAMHGVLRRTSGEELVLPGPSTESIRSRLTDVLLEERVPYWEATAALRESPVDDGAPAGRATSTSTVENEPEKLAGADSSVAQQVPGAGLDFTSEAARNAAVAAYTDHWTCSEAGLARTAKVDPADLSKWKKGLLPAESDKKKRIEEALKNNDPPTPPPKRPTDS